MHLGTFFFACKKWDCGLRRRLGLALLCPGLVEDNHKGQKREGRSSKREVGRDSGMNVLEAEWRAVLGYVLCKETRTEEGGRVMLMWSHSTHNRCVRGMTCLLCQVMVWHLMPLFCSLTADGPTDHKLL